MTPITREQARELIERHASGDECWYVNMPALLTDFAEQVRQQVTADLAQRSGRPWPVKAADHPDFVGGVVWSTLELNFLDERDKKWATVVASTKAKLEQSEARVRELESVVSLCKTALAEELSAWDIDPPLHHVKEAHDACAAALNKEPGHEA